MTSLVCDKKGGKRIDIKVCTAKCDEPCEEYRQAVQSEDKAEVPAKVDHQKLDGKIRTLALELNIRWLALGRALKVMKQNKWYLHYAKTWEDYCLRCLESVGLKQRALEWIEDASTLCDKVGIPDNVAAQIGWSKLKELPKVLTEETKDHWIEIALKPETTVDSLHEQVREELRGDKYEEPKPKPKMVPFYLFPEQEELIERALIIAGREAGSDKRGYLIADVICADFLSGHPDK